MDVPVRIARSAIAHCRIMRYNPPRVPDNGWSGEGRRVDVGVVNADVTVGNPADRSKIWRGSFMVDTDVTDSLVPRRHPG